MENREMYRAPGGTIFHFNYDLSGAVRIEQEGKDPFYYSAEVIGTDLIDFMLHGMRITDLRAVLERAELIVVNLPNIKRYLDLLERIARKEGT